MLLVGETYKRLQEEKIFRYILEHLLYGSADVTDYVL